MKVARWLVTAGLIAIGLVGSGRGASAQLPPDEAWRTVDTEHFRITYPEGLSELARRAGERAERAYEELSREFVEPPGGKIDLVVTDHADITSGFAQVKPSNRIVVYAPPPVDGFSLSYFDEWMELVVTHELVHIFHIDESGFLGSVVRGLFGRLPVPWPVFPGQSTPRWTREGIATYYESALTDAGRTRGSYHEMVTRTAILEEAFEDIGQAAGDSPVWPGGNRYYVYGSLFFQYLLEKYGPERMGRFTHAVAGQWIPFRLDSAARDAFGTSFSQAWEEWEAELAVRYREVTDSLEGLAPLSEPEVLTTEGQYAISVAVSPDGEQLAYARSDGWSDVQVHIQPANGGGATKLTRTNRLSNLAWTPGGQVLFSQVEYEDRYRVWSDLYLAGPDGDVRRLTRGLRLDHPHVAPNGVQVVAVQERGGTNRLVILDLRDGEVESLGEYELDVHWAYPRWSPDGHWIVASRWRPGAYYDLVLLDRSGRVVRELTHDRAVDISPSWSGDGRWLLWSSDRTGIPNLFALAFDPESGEVGPVRQVTNVLGGAGYPAVDPEGRWIYFSGYHAHGWQLERIPFRPNEWFDPFPLDRRFAGDAPEAYLRRFQEEVVGPEGRYRPILTLFPRYWEPTYRSGESSWIDREGQPQRELEVLGPAYGIFTSGSDLVGRHAFSVAAALAPEQTRFHGGVGYSYAGLGNPVLTVAGSQSYDALSRSLVGHYSDGGEEDLFLVEREREASLSASFVRQRYRDVTGFTLSGGLIWEELTLWDDEMERREDFEQALIRPAPRLAEARLTLFAENSRMHAFSISREDGVGAYVRVRARTDRNVPSTLTGQAGGDRSFQDLSGQLRAYKAIRGPGFANHVLALRVSGGGASGSGADAFHFEVGGAAGRLEQITGFGLFGGSSLLFPVRGYPEESRFGRYAWSASAEYRVPLAIVNQGMGLFPLFLDRLSASVFFDAGNAWGPELVADGEGVPGYYNPMQDALLSAGAELLARALPFWMSTVQLRLGVGFPFTDGRDPSVYLRVGTAF